MDNRLPLLVLLAMSSSLLEAEPVYVPDELREPSEYVLPGSRYGLINGSPGIPQSLASEGDHRDLMRMFMGKSHDIDALSPSSEIWNFTHDPEDLPQGWRFGWAGRIECPAAACLLLGSGGLLNWILTVDTGYQIVDVALIGAGKYGVAEGGGRYRRLAIMDSVFGWDGDRVTPPSNFADTGIFCTDYLRDPVYGVSGGDGFGRYFMRQVMPDGRILSRELTSWKDCVESDPIEPLGSTELND